jgi:3-isopropylmalate/(R)-2-methylmalate dehydratase large subunit
MVPPAPNQAPRTLLDKVWDAHVVADLDGGYQLLHVDRHLVHDLGGPLSLRALEKRGLRVHSPQLTFATVDHSVSSEPGRNASTSRSGARLLPLLDRHCHREGIEVHGLDSPDQGIVHVIGPELGLTLPGATVVCGDSHTCTHGALGALAWGIGTSEVTHVLATQCVIERKPLRLRITIDGTPPPTVGAKDVALHLLARHGADLGVGHAIEYAGSYIRALDVEGRLTICNLSIELGAKIGMIAPDDVTFDYLAGRDRAPWGSSWERAVAAWQTLATDPGARFDAEVEIGVDGLAPQVTWGTSPAQGGAIDDPVPDPSSAPDRTTADAWAAALDYMGLTPGHPMRGVPIDRVFIGSCTNARIADLRAAARVVAGRRVATGVEAWVVPGSARVKAAAEAEGLDQVFGAAGFGWREPGCSMCVATNGEYVAPGQRCVSTSNRNFVGRQGPRARTHLASPVTAAASAIAGYVDAPGPERC